LWLQAIARPLGLAAALAVGLVCVWHTRELFMRPVATGSVLLVSAGVGLLWYVAALRPFARPQARSDGAVCAVAAALLVALVVSAFELSNGFRWHLLRHNPLLGTPAYYALARPVPVVREELWQRARPASDGGPIAAPVPGERPTDVPSPPHIVFVLVDTLRADALAAWGGEPDAMPATNALAERSVLFTDVIANSSWTRPSVASYFTGLLQEQHGAVDRGFRLVAERETLAEVLSAAGYETAAFVANYANVAIDSGFAQGFDRFIELRGSSTPYARAEQLNRAAFSWLRGRRSDEDAAGRPLFLYLHYLDPHTPYLSGGPITSHDPAVARAGYREELRYLDSQLAELYEALPRLLPGPTLLLLVSDHGEEFGEHGEGGHGHALYSEVTRVPVLLRTPGDRIGKIDAPLEGRDFYDLLIRLGRSQEVDFRAWAEERGRRRGSRRYTSLYVSTPSAPHRPYKSWVAMRGVEDDGELLIWSGYGEVFELYDLESDPGQLRNVASDRPETVRQLAAALDEAVEGWVELEPVDESTATVELLRELGYIR
jgi:arylsulfatase A-like enzyme